MSSNQIVLSLLLALLLFAGVLAVTAPGLVAWATMEGFQVDPAPVQRAERFAHVFNR